MKKNILTKEKIEALAFKIFEILDREGLSDALYIYFNDKRMGDYGEFNEEGRYIVERRVEENINPHDYFQYCAFKHILSISTEGGLYDWLNYGSGEFPKELENIFEELGIYWELGDSWNLSFYPIDDNMEVEYTYYEDPREKEIIYRYREIENAPSEIQNIMEAWYELSKQKGDVGGCVLCAWLEFKYQSNKCKMLPCSPWQGEGSWTPYVDFVIKSLQNIGATNIKWNPGILD